MMRWYVIQSKPRKEFFLQSQLLRCGLDFYLPCVRVKRVNPRARKIQPYFPGYIFVRADIEKMGLSYFQWMPGAAGIVCFGGEPASMPGSLMDSLQAKIDRILAKSDPNQVKMKSGDKVKIHDGPFKGYEGIFKSHLAGETRARVLLTFLEDRHIRIDLPVEAVQLNSVFSGS